LKAAGPAEVGMAFLRGDETPSEIIILAYGMEEGLQGFYGAMALKTGDREVSVMFERLAGIEVLHKRKLFELYREFNPTVSDAERFETETVAEVMEGGLTTEEFLAQNKPAMNTISDVLDIAMMIETQALDLYLRYSHKARDQKSEGVMYDIAEEEKAHLAALGRLREARG
jgi:rubrerythrin